MSNTIGLDTINYKKKSFQIITEHCAVRYNCFQRLSNIIGNPIFLSMGVIDEGYSRNVT